MNRKFADKVLEVYDGSDLVWAHDYHLLLLPSYLMRKVFVPRQRCTWLKNSRK